MQLKEKTSACILRYTKLHCIWHNSAVLHKEGDLIGNMHTKYNWKISYHSLNIIEKLSLHSVGRYCFKGQVWNATTQNMYCNNKKYPCTGKIFTIQVTTLIEKK